MGARHSSQKKILGVSASVVVSLYFTLAMVAFFCTSNHSNHNGHHAHHSSICFWACQANNGIGLISFTTPLLPILLTLILVERLTSRPLHSISVTHPPRAPPRF